MTEFRRPVPYPSMDWNVVSMFLTADEQVALNKLARQERRERSDMAALLVKLALEERGLLAREVADDAE